MLLRPPRGAYAVGSTTLTAPVQPPITVGTGLTIDGPALVLDEVAFTVYYPCAGKGKKGVPWLSRPIQSTVAGFGRFAGFSTWLLAPIFYIFGVFLSIPVHPNAPLLRPPENNKQWLVVVFSHGLCGFRTAYSQFCAEIASSGRVVLAVEHRDGTAPATISRSGRTVLYYRQQDVAFPEDRELPGPLPLRTEQLEFRRLEIYRIYEAFCALVKEGVPLQDLNGEDLDLRSWTESSGLPMVRTDEIALTGHSFGGCTVLDILSSPPIDSSQPLPVTHALVLDPWLEPLPTPGPVSIHPPSSLKLLVINSQYFTLWKDHYTRVLALVREWDAGRGKLLTIVGSVHQSFSDFPLLPLVRARSAETIIERIAELSRGFLNDTLDATLQGAPTREYEEKVIGKRPDGRPRRTLVGDVGDVVCT